MGTSSQTIVIDRGHARPLNGTPHSPQFFYPFFLVVIVVVIAVVWVLHHLGSFARHFVLRCVFESYNGS